MKIKDIFLLASINIKSQKKQFIIYSIIITLIFLIATVAIQIPYNIKSFMHTMIYDEIGGRELFALKLNMDVKDMIQELNEIEHVIYAYNDQYNVIYGDVKFDNTSELTSIKIIPINDKFSPLIVKGRKAVNKGEIVCPVQFAMGDKSSKDELTSLSNYLNKNIEIFYYQPTFKLKNEEIDNTVKVFTKNVNVVGLYMNALSITSSSECYMIDDELIEMKSESKILYSEGLRERVSDDALANHIIIDNPKNADIVIEELARKGYDATRAIEFDFDLIKSINFTSYFILFVLIIIIFLILILYTKKIVNNQKNDISLYKMFGYTNKDISKITMTELFFIYFFGYIISIIIFLIGITIFNMITNNLLYNLLAICKLKLSIMYELILFAITFLLLYFITKINLSIINKLEIKEILNYDNDI